MLGGLLLLCTLWGHAADILAIHVDRSSQQFAVTLPANPTTGYQWTVTTYDKQLLHVTSSHYAARQTKRIGAGGEMIFIFALNKGKSYPNSTRMLFTYARPWDSKSGSLKRVIINFNQSKR